MKLHTCRPTESFPEFVEPQLIVVHNDILAGSEVGCYLLIKTAVGASDLRECKSGTTGMPPDKIQQYTGGVLAGQQGCFEWPVVIGIPIRSTFIFTHLSDH